MLRPYKGGRRILREDQLGNEERVAQIRQRVVKALRRMNGAQRMHIIFSIFADAHFIGTGFSLCSDRLCKLRRPKTEQAEACST